MGNGASTLDNAGPLQLPVSPRSAKGNRKTSKTKMHWDGEGWVLHFPKDVDVRPSAKNFQLADRAGRVCLTLARTMADTYCVEFAAPLSEFTALCACLASIKSYRAFQS